MAAPSFQRSSILPLDPSTQYPSAQNFGELSQFLRSSMADDESLQMADGMGVLAACIDAVLASLKNRSDPAAMAPLLMDLMTHLRQHRALVVELGAGWRGLYEYASYLAALNNFRVLIGQWLLAAKQQAAQVVSFADFELVAWRTLGEGMLLIDMREQFRKQAPVESSLAALDESRVQRARSWWDRLRG